jgi:DNA-directed RNA polymerase specialized sigma24 family protein
MIQKTTDSPEAFRAALQQMAPVDLVRLQKAARFASRRLQAWGWEDLLQEAVRRGLEGTRVWPAHVPVVLFLVQTMRSLAREQWEHEHRPAATTISTSSIKRAEPAPDAGPERVVAVRQELTEIRSWFADDAAALAVLEGMADGLGPGEIQQQSALDERAYKAAQKRIRRAVLKHLGDES